MSCGRKWLKTLTSKINEKLPNLNGKLQKKTKRDWSMKNLLTQWKLRRKIERCVWVSSPGGYTKKELRDPCIGGKPPNIIKNWEGKPRDQLMKSLAYSIGKKPLNPTSRKLWRKTEKSINKKSPNPSWPTRPSWPDWYGLHDLLDLHDLFNLHDLLEFYDLYSLYAFLLML